MIEELRLSGLGVIESANLAIGAGFTAITGETGAGKTMVVTALGLLLGQRADSAVVRAGARQAAVDGVWLVNESGAVADRVRESGGDLEPAGAGLGELYLARTVSAEGRSRASVAGRAVPAASLAQLAAQLVVVHGQSDQLRLRSSALQRDALDRFGGEALIGVRDRFAVAHLRVRDIERERTALQSDRDARRAEGERLRASLAEIESVAPVAGEDAELAARADRLAHAEELRLAAATAHELISGDDDGRDAAGLLAEARRVLERGAADDATLSPLADAVADLGYRAADLAAALAGYLADLDEAGPHELAAVEERRALLGPLIRAHGGLDAAIQLLDTGSARLADLDGDDDRIVELDDAFAAASADLDSIAAELTTARTNAGARLSEAVTAELRALALPDARFAVRVSAAGESAAGRDEVTFLLAPHPGAEPRAVARGASGGELSRVMLAIEVVIAQSDPVPTFVFDEVDAGIGGAAAIEVGRRLARLAESSQVIVVTHLAQVAAFASNHLAVAKQSDGTVTASSVHRLEGAAREREIARLLSGSESDAALRHARELLADAGAVAPAPGLSADRIKARDG